MMKTLLALMCCILAVTPGHSLIFDIGDVGGIDIDIDESLSLNLELLDWGFGFKLPIYKNEYIVFMQRIEGGTLDFYRGWDDYANGFQGENGQEFWLGNEKVYNVTSKMGAKYTLRVEVLLESNRTWYYAEYSSFYLEPRDKYYAIHFSEYSGNAGDSLSLGSVGYYCHKGMAFSTFDNDRSEDNLTQLLKGSWWFNNYHCYYCCLTCARGNTFMWTAQKNLPTSGPLLAARMMIRKN